MGGDSSVFHGELQSNKKCGNVRKILNDFYFGDRCRAGITREKSRSKKSKKRREKGRRAHNRTLFPLKKR